MAKKKRKGGGRPGSETVAASRDRYTRDVKRAFRRLQVPSTTSLDTFEAQVATLLPVEDRRRYQRTPETDRTALVLTSPEMAIGYGIGWREQFLTRTIPWVASLLPAPAEDRARLFVDVGAGTGITAALVNQMTGAHAVAVDSDPHAGTVIPQIADRVGAAVETHVADAADTPTVLDGRVPDLLLAQAVLTYFGFAHDHYPGMEWVTAVQRRMADPEDLGPSTRGVLRAAEGGTLVLIDTFCMEVIASLVGTAARHGLQIDPAATRTFTLRIEDHFEYQTGLVFRSVAVPLLPDPVALLDAVNGRPGPPRVGDSLSGWSAESTFATLDPPTYRHRCFDEQARPLMEVLVGQSGDLAYTYQRNADGVRRLTFAYHDQMEPLQAMTREELGRDSHAWQHDMLQPPAG